MKVLRKKNDSKGLIPAVLIMIILAYFLGASMFSLGNVLMGNDLLVPKLEQSQQK